MTPAHHMIINGHISFSVLYSFCLAAACFPFAPPFTLCWPLPFSWIVSKDRAGNSTIRHVYSIHGWLASLIPLFIVIFHPVNVLSMSICKHILHIQTRGELEKVTGPLTEGYTAALSRVFNSTKASEKKHSDVLSLFTCSFPVDWWSSSSFVKFWPFLTVDSQKTVDAQNKEDEGCNKWGDE